MSIVKILVPVSGSPTDAVAIDAGLVAAQPFAAHVQCLFVPPDPRLSIPQMGAPASPDVIDSIMKSLEEMNKKASARAIHALNDAARRQDVEICEVPKKLDHVSCSFREDTGLFALRTGRHARLSDLVVFAALPEDTFSDANEAFVETLIRTERPVLIAREAPATLTKKISVAWDGGIPCAHAMMAALPFLKHAGNVELLEIEPVSGNGLTVAEGKEYLALQGIPASMRFVKRASHRVAETLLREAADGGASLLVMGGYGHNRFAETIFGGVTTHIKWHATLPVLMSH